MQLQEKDEEIKKLRYQVSDLKAKPPAINGHPVNGKLKIGSIEEKMDMDIENKAPMVKSKNKNVNRGDPEVRYSSPV